MPPNKLIRSDNYNSRLERRSKEKSKLRRERRKLEEEDPSLRHERLRRNVPVTIESKRVYDPTRYEAAAGPEGDEASSADEAEDAVAPVERRTTTTQTDGVEIKEEADEIGALLNGDGSDRPKDSTKEGMKTLITTSPNPTKISYHFMAVLESIFPLSETIRRGTGKYKIGDIAKYASNRGYQNLIVVNEDRKKPNAISFIRLPAGPTAYFTVTSLDIRQLASHTTHFPELLLNNFTTALGVQVAEVFKSLFPIMPHLQGRQTVTLQNSRDFVFLRRHRYMFVGEGDRVRLQEIGPRFTLKCREVVDGVARNGKLVWQSNAGMESDRKRMFL